MEFPSDIHRMLPDSLLEMESFDTGRSMTRNGSHLFYTKCYPTIFWRQAILEDKIGYNKEENFGKISSECYPIFCRKYHPRRPVYNIVLGAIGVDSD
jgi:hypothetical protein